jgi:hypothetical protein
MLPDIQALIQGTERGKMQLAGMVPSAQNVGGAAPPIDPTAPQADLAERVLLDYVAALNAARDDRNANRVLKLVTALGDVKQDRRKEIADYQASGQNGPSGGGLAAVQGLHAMGVPNGQ